MHCSFQAERKCLEKAAWIVEDAVTGKAWAVCGRHIAHNLGRVNSVVSIDEDGPEMRRVKELLNESSKS